MAMANTDFTATAAVFGWDAGNTAEYRSTGRGGETDADFGWEGAPYDAGHGHGDCPACGGDGYQVVKVPGCHERFVDCEECGCTGIGRQDAEADCPLCTGDSEARGLCDRHADELSQLTFTAEQLEAAAAR